MSPRTDLASDIATIGPDDDFILIRVEPSGEVTSLSTLDEEEAVDLLRQTADEIEVDGFERQKVARLS
ncbi:MAG: hypothetical protein RLZ51_1860 [Pseudomonadota bacterium]|jgi:hypothetical protein